MKCSVFIATSLDGFIARENGDLDWLPGSTLEGQTNVAAEDFGYKDFLESIDVIIMGRKTFDLVKGFSPWPYAGKQMYVLSRNYPADGIQITHGIIGTSLDPTTLAEKLSTSGHKHAYIDGGITIQRFLRAGLIREMVITRVPILLGTGIPLFGPLEKDLTVTHIETKSYSNGLTQSCYYVEF